MQDAVIVTGLMRSGTSLVAAILHRLGWFAGTYLSAPMPPSWRSDWEDPWSVELMMGEPLKPNFFRNWMAAKRSSASVFGFKRILLKSPFLALHLDKVRLVEKDIFVVETRRDSLAIQASMDRHPQLLEDDQVCLEKALLKVKPNYVFDTDRCQDDPRNEILSLCMALGFDPGPDLEDAIGLVEQKKAQVF